MSREQGNRKRFGLQLFAGEDSEGLEVMIKPETGTLRLGDSEAPFAVSDLPEDEDIEIRIFVDKYLVEVFVNDRQSTVATYQDYKSGNERRAYTYGDPTTFRKIEIWKMKPTNAGFLEALESHIWEADTE